MRSKTARTKPHSYDAYLIVTIVALVVTMLFAFERMTGLPASIRGTEIYNVLPMPPSIDVDTEEEEARVPTVTDLTKERVCDRVSIRFGSDYGLWQRVNERVWRSLGFRCSR